MPFPPVLYAAALSQALPLIAGLSHRGRPLPAPVRWLLAWCALGLATDVLSMIVMFVRGANTWIQYVAVPLSSGLVLWTLSAWQQHEVLRLAYRLVIPALGLATIALLLALPPASTFDQLVAPFH